MLTALPWAGPNELTIFAPSVTYDLNSTKAGATRAPWYDFLSPLLGLVSIRTNAFHDQRRQVWERGFSARALREYQGRIARYGRELEACLAAQHGAPVDVTEWFYWYSFDFMGDFAFAQSFRMLQTAQWHHGVRLMRGGLSLLGYLSPVPWLGQVALSYAFLPPVRRWNEMVKWCGDLMQERIQVSGNPPG
jgi:cytochrome P450